MSRGWNISEIFDEIRATIPDAPALIHGDVERTWNVMHQRSESLAAIMLASGVSEQSKVAQYLYNGPEYLESVLAAFSAGLAVVNTNYRYAADELVYLWDNADVEIVVFHGSFTERIEEIRDRVSDVKLWIRVDDDSTALPNWAIDYETIVSAPPVGPAHGPWGRSGDHLLLLYTGGTTGMPKGVMWRQDDLVGALDASNRRRLPESATPGAVAERLSGPGPRGLPGAPLMHGTGFFNAISTMMLGGSTTTLTGRRFDVNELLDTIEQRRINSISIVGDAFAKPMLAALEAEPKRWDLSSLRVIVSSGVMWARTTKEGLLRHNPRLIMVDTLGSSEAIGMASNVSTRESIGARGGTARFELGPNTRVVDDAGNDVQRGSGQRGRVALRGRTPIGYYKDAEKSAATFQVIDGVRYSIPGDWAEVETDGTVVLLGRGSQCINTGGEKVYPEEVEEIIKTMPTVRDCAVVGVPDDRFGEAICAIVETDDGSKPELSQISHHVRQHLAGYKVPRHVVHVSSVGRAVNGKLDYRTLRTEALERIDGA